MKGFFSTLFVLIAVGAIAWLGYQAVDSHIRAQDTVGVAHEAFDYINEERKSDGIHPLVWNSELERLAIKHSQWMKDNDMLVHSSYKYAECVLQGGDIFSNGWQVYHPWRDSWRHASIMCDSEYTRGAIGIVDKYATFLAR